MGAQDFIDKRFSYAVVGATTNKEKYGFKVLMYLSDVGFQVVGVNPKYAIIENVPVYPTLADIPGNVDVAIFVVPPDVGLHLLPQVEEKGITKVWFQPGAESNEIADAVREAGFSMNDPGTCIMTMHELMTT